MRNALVLVPLCIGLSSGFIVTTGTSEAYSFTKIMLKSKRDVMISPDEDKSKNESNNSMKIDLSISYDNLEDKIKQELYNQGLEEDKNINERSFVFVNQRWKKIPTKTHLIDTKPGNPHLNRSFVLNVFEETIVPGKKIAARLGNTNIKYADERDKEINKSKKNNYFPVKNQQRGSIQTNSDIYSKYHKENEIALKYTIKSDQNLHSRERQNPVDNIINDYMKINEQAIDDRKYFKTINNGNNAVHRNEYKNKQTDKFRSKYDNVLFKIKQHEVINDVNENHFPEYNLFQHTLEEQIPEKAQRHNDNKLNYLKYCQECSQKVNIRKLNSRLDLECKCKCGRYIHLRGPPRT